jgi:DNA-binding NarL/FixJ family response regulator
MSDPNHTERPTREKVAELLERGYPVRQIAKLLDLTTQAVYKHKKALSEKSA